MVEALSAFAFMAPCMVLLMLVVAGTNDLFDWLDALFAIAVGVGIAAVSSAVLGLVTVLARG